MEIVSLGGFGGDTSELNDELSKLGGGIGWWRWESPGNEVCHAFLPDDPEKAARGRELIQQWREQHGA